MSRQIRLPRLTRRALFGTLAAGAAALVASQAGGRHGPALAFGPRAGGTLVEYASGAPIANAEIQPVIDGSAQGAIVRTDAQGGFSASLPEGATALQVRHPEFATASLPLEHFTDGAVIRLQRGSRDAATEQTLFAKPRQLLATGALPEGQAIIRSSSATLDRLSCRVTLLKSDGSYVEMEMNEYLRGVVPSEMPASWGSFGGFEALKAQAVACRTYAARIQATRGYLTAGESDQVWQPIYHEITDRAIRETGYEIMAYNGECVIGYYSSTCGGHSTDGPYPYLVGKRCNAEGNRMDLSNNGQATWFYSSPDIASYCKWAGSPVYRWTAYWDRPTLETILDTYLPLVPDVYRSAPYFPGELGTLVDIQPLNHSVAGKVGILRIVTTTGTWDIDHEYWIRSLLRNTVTDGPQYSAQFGLSLYRPDGVNIEAINLYGGGWGHALGMCQYGAYGMAREGRDYRAILNHYFPNIAYYQLAACQEVDAIPNGPYVCRPGEGVRYAWTPVPGVERYKVEVRDRYGQVVSVSGIVDRPPYEWTLPAPGPADEYTWYLIAMTGGVESTLVQRRLVTTDHLRRYHLPAVLNQRNG